MSGSPELYIVSDLDDVWIPTAQCVLDFSNEQLGQQLTTEDYHEDFPRLWGVSREAATELVLRFYDERMSVLPMAEGARAVHDNLPAAVTMDLLTSRRLIVSSLTRAWTSRNLQRVGEVHFTGVDWANDPLAHTRSKIDDLVLLKPDLYLEDLPKHVFPAAEKDIPTIVRNQPWNIDVEFPPNVRRAQCMHQLGDMIAGDLEQKAA